MNIKDRIDYLTDRLAEVKEERDYWKAEAERVEFLLENINND